MAEDRVLVLEGVNNFRDYGDYAVTGGGRVKKGVLWRSGQHVGATDSDLAAIAAVGLVTVTDLRGEGERELNPCRRHEGFAAEVLLCEGENVALASHFDAAAGVMDEAGARKAMRTLYAEMPYRPNLIGVLRRHFAALADRDGASLIHCFAGKDRTGFSVALAHHVLGVHYDDATQDYMLTNAAILGRHFPGNPGHDAGKYASLSKAAAEALGGVKEEYLDAAFNAMRESHCSVDGYLGEVLGVDAPMRDRIKARFTES